MHALLSVIMTVHNGGPYLHDAVASLLGQTYSQFELIIVENGSTDDSPHVLRGYEDPRLRIISTGCKLPRTEVLNIAFQEAQGDYVAVQDADDLSLSHRLEHQMAYLSQHPDTALLGTNCLRIDSRGKTLSDHPVPVSNAGIAWTLLFQNCFAHSTVVFNRKKVRAIGGYDVNFHWAQDYALFSHLMRKGENLAFLPKILVHIRAHPKSTSYTMEKELQQEPSRISCDNFRHFLPGLSATSVESLSAIVREERQPVAVHEALDAMTMLIQLYDSFVARAKTPLSKSEVHFLKRDVAKRLARFAAAWRKTFPDVARETRRTSFRWDRSGKAFLWALVRPSLVQTGALPMLKRFRGFLRK